MVTTGATVGFAVTFIGAAGRGGKTRDGLGAGAAAGGMLVGLGGIDAGITGKAAAAGRCGAAAGGGEGLGGNEVAGADDGGGAPGN